MLAVGSFALFLHCCMGAASASACVVLLWVKARFLGSNRRTAQRDGLHGLGGDGVGEHGQVN
jgi:hypothetical protein